MASRWARKRSSWPSAPTAGPRTRNSSCPTASTSISRAISAPAARSSRAEWTALFERYRAALSGARRRCERMQRRDLPEGWDKDIPTFPADPKGIASRDSSAQVLNAIAPRLPVAARRRGRPRAVDQDPARLSRAPAISRRDDHGGRNFHFGIREHAMGSICNGLALSKLRPFGSRLPDLLRLHEAADPARGDHGAAGRLRLHA